MKRGHVCDRDASRFMRSTRSARENRVVFVSPVELMVVMRMSSVLAGVRREWALDKVTATLVLPRGGLARETTLHATRHAIPGWADRSRHDIRRVRASPIEPAVQYGHRVQRRDTRDRRAPAGA
eukprot:7238493-Prymnesium_polylepis.1